MAIGYSTVMSKYNEHYFDHLISFLDSEFTLFSERNVLILNDEGDVFAVSLEDIRRSFSVNLSISIKFRNRYDHWISCTVSCIGNYLAIEEYSLDELLTEQEYDELYGLLLKRSSELAASKKVIGFIFDSDGYTEDYIQILKPPQ